jgi:ferrous iron transport protein A
MQHIAQSQSLADLTPGASGRIVAINGGRELSRRLLGLGLRVGSEVRVEHRRGRGLVVSAGATRIALGGGIVEKLLVVPLATGMAGSAAADPAD